MNLKTTFLLLALIAAGAFGWYRLTQQGPSINASKTLVVLEKEIKPEAITHIELIRQGQPPVTLEKTGQEWSLPGSWPVRGPEVRDLIKTLSNLRTRFAPETATKEELAKKGLSDGTLTIKLKVAGKSVTLKLSEETTDQNRFTRATYLNMEGEDQIIRLGPGIIAALDRSQEYFQQRRLFPNERVAKADDPESKIEQVAAREIRLKGPDGVIVLDKKADGWQITTPVKDQVDPEKMRGILTGFLDLWAERFVNTKGKSLDEMGLAKPEYTLQITRPNGGDITVLVGKISESKDKIIQKPAPPPSPFAPPQKPSIQIVKEEYRYAKLPENGQIFEIKTDRLKDLTLPLSEVRDARLVRFKADDVKKVEIQTKNQTLILAKEKDKWRLEKPAALDAESQPVAELLEKLAALEAKGGDVRDKDDAKATGLDAPAGTLTLTLGEPVKKSGDKAGKDDKTVRTLVYKLGESAKEKGKLFVQVAGWPRVNLVADDVLKLAQREALVYRQRRLLDVGASDLTKIQIQRGGEDYVLERKDGTWSLIQPVAAKVEQGKVEQIAGDLARLETPEFISENPKADDLDQKYGLAKPGTKITLTFADAKKPPQTLLIGKARPFKDDSFARLDNGPVFVLKKESRELLDRDALAYRSVQAWQVASDAIVEMKVRRDGQAFTLTKKDKTWNIAGPFDAPARLEYLDAMTEELGQLKSEKYVAQGAKDLAKFGLDKPYIQVEIVTKAEAPKDKDFGKEKIKEEPKEKSKDVLTTSVLQVGKTDESGKSRYARVGDGDAIFLVSEKALAILDRRALDLLDRVLLKLDVAGINLLRFKGPTSFTLEKKKDEWQVVAPPAPTFTAEDDVVQSVLRPLDNLLAGKIAAYGPKTDWAAFGLDNPSSSIIVSLADKDKKAIEHTVALGKDAGEGKRFARVDQQQAVAVLEPDVVKALVRSHLDFLNPRVLKFPFDGVTGITRVMKDGDLELAKRDDSWQLVKPGNQPADNLTVDDIVEKTFQLKARRFAAFPAQDLKPFGLDTPVATATIVLNDGKKHVLKIGTQAGSKDQLDERFALIDEGKAGVVVLSADLSRHLTASPLYFADRNLASFGGADRIDFTRGDRKGVFVKTGTAWKMADPIKADVEDTLPEFLQSLFRLRADEVVAGKDADLKAFGLEKPAAQWKFLNGDREMLSLIVGGIEKGKEKDAQPRRYAKLAKGDQVFLLSGKLSAAAFAEYRTRKPWPALDAAQIDGLKVVGAAGTFILTKRDGTWSVKDRPEAKVDAKSVTDLLDALAGLKADRYVADAKGDLQLYGLQPPAGSIDIATPAGPRTLLLGRTEGDSRRIYAAILGNDAVFTLSEDDARRLTRPAAGYLETK